MVVAYNQRTCPGLFLSMIDIDVLRDLPVTWYLSRSANSGILDSPSHTTPIITMSELFFGYEQEFVRCLAQTEKKLEGLAGQPNSTPSSNAVKQELAFNDLKLELSEVERQLKFMETESSSMAPHIRPKFHEKVVKYKREYNEMKRKILRQE